MELGRRAVEDPLAVGEDEQAVAVALGLEQVVGRVDHRRPGAGEAEDELPEPLALARVEPGRGLVEQQHRGRGEQADRDVDPLLVAARERPDLIVAALAQVGLVEHPLDRALDVVDLLEAGEQAQVLRDREPPVERRLLRHPADLAGERRPRPASGSRIPARIESSVVLPAPLGPITASSSPGAAANDTSRSAARSPKLLPTPSTSIAPLTPAETLRTK